MAEYSKTLAVSVQLMLVVCLRDMFYADAKEEWPVSVVLFSR
jgi:hypothetical protein